MRAFLTRLLREPSVVLRRLLQCIFVWRVPNPCGNPATADLIVVQSASDCIGNATSTTNIALADAAQVLHETHGTPIFPQAEVGRVLNTRGVATIATTPIYSTISLLTSEYGAGSYDVALLHKQLCVKHGWTKVVVLAYHPHIVRVVWIYEKLGFEVIVPSNVPRMTYQSTASQWRHRRAITSLPYELAARLWFLYQGYI